MFTTENLICIAGGFLVGVITAGIVFLIILIRSARWRAAFLRDCIFFRF